MFAAEWQGVPGWEQLPAWIAATATSLAFLAAVVAGLYARKAAIHTGEQAQAARAQLRLAGESKLDALTPLIYAVARPEDHPHWLRYAVPSGEARYRSSTDPSNGWEWGYFPSISGQDSSEHDVTTKRGFFRFSVLVDFHNASTVVARVEFPEQAGAVYSMGNQLVDWPVIVLPDKQFRVLWRHVIPWQAFANDATFTDEANTSFRFHFHVRDLGLNVLDTYRFKADLTLFSRSENGSLINVSVRPKVAWEHTVAVLGEDREYTRQRPVVELPVRRPSWWRPWRRQSVDGQMPDRGG